MIVATLTILKEKGRLFTMHKLQVTPTYLNHDQINSLLLNVFYHYVVSECFDCMYLCALCVCSTQRHKGGHLMAWNLRCRQ